MLKKTEKVAPSRLDLVVLPVFLHPVTRLDLKRLGSGRGKLCHDWSFGIRERTIFRRCRQISVSQWAEQYRVLHVPLVMATLN